jgi:hypothetical protein
MTNKRLGLRWTVGDVSESGFESLHLSLWSAWRLFGENAKYAVAVNGIALEQARRRVGEAPDGLQWVRSEDFIPKWLDSHVDSGMAEGVAWKLCPVRVFPGRYELSFDNDVILWEVPAAIRSWLNSSNPEACLMAEDLQRCLGQFADLCDPRSINSGIRGLPPEFDYELRLRQTLAQTGIKMRSELDEQGLQAATLSGTELYLVSTTDVSICSPFPMHQKTLGRCGAHFVGLNPKQLPWTIDGRPAHQVIREFWQSHREELEARVWADRELALATGAGLRSL